MVDVDRRISPPGISPSHAAGLRRLSARASTTARTARTAGLHSFAPLASALVSLFNRSSIPLSPGLSEAEMVRIESRLNFTFPPDLRALLSLAVPSAPGFPDWRSLPSLPSLFRFPAASVCLHVASSHISFWPPASSWGPRPADPDLALSAARSNLRRAPPLVPLFGRCYLPSLPSLAGNPVFFVDEDRLFCCASDLRDFFSRLLSSGPDPLSFEPKAPTRWIEFWTDASSSPSHKRSSSSSSSSSQSQRSSSSSSASLVSMLTDPGPDPERFVEIRPPKVPQWVEQYMDTIGSALRDGGWGEVEVEEMVHVSASCSLDCEEAIMDVLALRADRWSESLRTAGWSSDDVAEVLGTDLGLVEKMRRSRSRRAVKLPPEIRFKFERLAEEILGD